MLNAIKNAVTSLTSTSAAQAADKYTTSASEPAVISIKANYTTPYRWKVTNAPAGLEISEKYNRTSSRPGMVGVGGTVDVTVKPGTCKPGTYLVEMGNFRFGSDDAVDSKTFAIEVKASGDTKVLANGESASVKIPANYTTPFQWKVISAPEGMTVTSKYKSNPNPNGMMGVGGNVTFTITPETCPPGTYTIELGNFSLFGDDQPWNTKSVQVVVK